MASSNDLRRILIGAPLATNQAIHQRLNKPKALAVFSSDALSSSAYATEAILLVLIAAGAGALSISLPIAVGIATLLLIVAFSYFQTIHAYPNGGGAYIVAHENLGVLPGLTAAAALLIDYTLTVAVSVSAGVAAITSAFPSTADARVPIALVIVVFITLINLRGVKESGTFFSIPTYAFVFGVMGMIAFGVIRVITGNVPDPEEGQVVARELSGAGSSLTLFLLLRAYAAGCTALTGVEAISNGIPAFEPPESKNAGQTLIVMVLLLCTMFIGITFLANYFPVEVHEGHMDSTVLAQVSSEIFGKGSILFYYLQFATLFILSLAANTAFADFPRLASLISADRYLPRQLTNFGDRLVFSNGIILLAAMASLLIILFGAREHNMLPLYAVGVFISFTLSQSGMVIHWLQERKKEGFVPTGIWRFRLGLNAFGALCTFIVGMILMVTKFVEGAWIVMLAIPILIAMFYKIHRHYEDVAASLTLDGIKPGRVTIPPHREHLPVVVLMNSLNRCSLQALEYALTMTDNVHCCAIEVEPKVTDVLRKRWKEWGLDDIPIDVVKSPYREIGLPLLNYLHEFDQEHGRTDIPTAVIIPEFVVSKWWEKFLHNGTSVAIRAALYSDQIERGRGRPVINVPYRIGDERYEPDLIGELVEVQPEAAAAGQDEDSTPPAS